MAEPAIRGMTVDDFLGWEDGTDTRYELVKGFVVAMAPPAPPHGRLATALGGEIRAALRSRRHCGVYGEASIARPDRDEILSPSTTAFDRQTKVPDYRRIPSVQEILLIDSETVFAEVLRRDGDQWITEIVQGPAATLSLNSIPLAIPLAEIYEGIPLPAPRVGRSRTG